MKTMMNQLMKEAYKGDPKGYYNLALALQNEDNPNPVMIQAQLRKAAKGGYKKAIRHLAELGLRGELVTSNSVANRIFYYPNLNKAMSWISEGILSGDAACLYMRGKCFEFGLGYPKNESRALADINTAIAGLTEDEIFSINIMFMSVLKERDMMSSSPLKVS